MKFLLLFVLLGTIAYGQTPDNHRQDAPHNNSIKNGGFENGKARWTANGGTLTLASGDVVDGVRAGSFNTASIGDSLDTEAVTPSNGLKGKACLAKFEYKLLTGSVGDYFFKVESSTPTPITADQNLTVSSDWQTAQVGFICPSSGDMRISIEATDAAAGDLLVDGVWLGKDYRIGERAATVTGWTEYTPSVLTNIANTLTYAAYSQTGKTLSVRAKFVATGAATASISWESSSYLPDGFSFDGSHGDINRASCGTAQADEDGAPTTTDQSAAMVYIATNGDLFILDGDDDVWTSNVPFASWSNGDQIFIECHGIPVNEGKTTDQTVTLETQGWFVDANIGGTGQINLNTGGIVTYTPPANASLDLVNNNPSVPVGIPCNVIENDVGNLTCSGQNEQVGVIFNAPTSGVYQSCITFSMANNGNNTTWQIIQTPHDDDTTFTAFGGERIQVRSSNGGQSSSIPVKVCGIFNLTAGKTTLRLMREQSSTATEGQILADRASVLGDRDIHVSAIPLTANFPQAVALTGIENKWQRKYLTADATTDQTLTDLTMNNLVVGKVYRLTAHARLTRTAADNTVSLLCAHNGTTILNVDHQGESSGTSTINKMNSIVFTATSTTTTCDSSSASVNSVVRGNSTDIETWAQIEELNNHGAETTDFN